MITVPPMENHELPTTTQEAPSNFITVALFPNVLSVYKIYGVPSTGLIAREGGVVGTPAKRIESLENLDNHTVCTPSFALA